MGNLLGRMGPVACAAVTGVLLLAFCGVSALAFGGLSLLGISTFQSEGVPAASGANTEQVASPTPTLTAATSPEPTEGPISSACAAQQDDPAGDVFNRDTQEAADALGPDITQILARCQASRLIIEVWLANPALADLDMYSFAVEVFLSNLEGQDLVSALLQHHAGETTTEVRDAQSGQRIEGDGEIELRREDEQSVVEIAVPGDALGANRSLQVRSDSYYMAGSDTTFLGDSARIDQGVDLRGLR